MVCATDTDILVHRHIVFNSGLCGCQVRLGRTLLPSRYLKRLQRCQGLTHSFDQWFAKAKTGEQALYASDLLYILTLGFSKLATIQLISALSPDKRHKRVCHGLSAFVGLWTISAIFAIALRCNLRRPASDLTSAQCPSLVRKALTRQVHAADLVQFSRWAALESINLLSEIMMFVVTILMIRDLQMSLKRKAMASTIFAVRLPYVRCYEALHSC